METNIIKLLADFWKSQNIWLRLLRITLSILFISLNFATYGITLLQLFSGIQNIHNVFNADTEVNIDMDWLINNSNFRGYKYPVSVVVLY
jgi:hypothetical protein